MADGVVDAACLSTLECVGGTRALTGSKLRPASLGCRGKRGRPDATAVVMGPELCGCVGVRVRVCGGDQG